MAMMVMVTTTLFLFYILLVLSFLSVPTFFLQADSACGTTIGPITAAGSGIRTVNFVSAVTLLKNKQMN
jgi:aspartyl aminopeptidase